MKKVMLALASLSVLASSPSTHAEVLPADEVIVWSCDAKIDGNVEAIANAIEGFLKKNSIEQAAQLASTCAVFGSSIDVSLIAPVVEAINLKLKPLISKSDAKVLKALSKKCWDKGEAEGGSLGRSAAMHCDLKVTQGFFAAYKKWN